MSIEAEQPLIHRSHPVLVESFLNRNIINFDIDKLPEGMLKAQIYPFSIADGSTFLHGCLFDYHIKGDGVYYLVRRASHSELIYPSDFRSIILGQGKVSGIPDILTNHLPQPFRGDDADIFAQADIGPDHFSPTGMLLSLPYDEKLLALVDEPDIHEFKMEFEYVSVTQPPDSLEEFKEDEEIYGELFGNAKRMLVIDHDGVDLTVFTTLHHSSGHLLIAQKRTELYRNHLNYGIIPAVVWKYDQDGKPVLLFDFDAEKLHDVAIRLFEKEFPYLEKIRSVAPEPQVDKRRVNALAGALTLLNLDKDLFDSTDYSILEILRECRKPEVFRNSALFNSLTEWHSDTVAQNLLVD